MCARNAPRGVLPGPARGTESAQEAAQWQGSGRVHGARTVLNGKKKNLVLYKKTQNLGTEMELELQLMAVDLQLTAVGLQPTAVGL